MDFNKFNKMGLQFRIVLDDTTYDFEELKLIDLKLQNYIAKLVNDSMSPYEKYISIYNFVRKFKKYKMIKTKKIKTLKESLNNKWQSSHLKNILENKYIDCRGFSYLLETLLNKVGIESVAFGFDVYAEDDSKLGGHARTLINIDDKKYNLHGIFVSDPTWDSDNSDDNLEYSLLPLSSMRDKIYGECDTTLLFDFLNASEFEINFKKFCSEVKHQSPKSKIMEMICSIDIKKADEFYQKLMNYILLKNKI